jgi:hypothetical protein
MLNTRNAIGALIVATLSLAASAAGSAPVYAKDHRAHSFLPSGTYAQATSPEVKRAGYPRGADAWKAYQFPADANGNVINPTDYQRGGTN